MSLYSFPNDLQQGQGFLKKKMLPDKNPYGHFNQMEDQHSSMSNETIFS